MESFILMVYFPYFIYYILLLFVLPLCSSAAELLRETERVEGRLQLVDRNVSADQYQLRSIVVLLNCDVITT